VVRIAVLGPLVIGGVADLLQRRDQVVLSALVVRAGEALTPDRLADALWGESLPNSWLKQVHGSVLRVRRAIGQAAIETTPSGYRLRDAGVELDCREFADLVERGKQLAAESQPDRAAVAFGRALDLWRGSAFDGVLDGWPQGRVEADRLEELRRTAQEELLDARLESGEHRDVVAPAEALAAAEPLREHRWAILSTALYRCGRQADALRALRTARDTLREELGIEPSPELVALEHAILAQDAALAAVPVPPAISAECPYKGLAAYDVDDAATFFGRDGEVERCIDRLQNHPLLVVTGPSGSGKSSLVRAGLVAMLHRAGRAAVVFVPMPEPETALAEVLAASAASPVLVVDQFEEVFLGDGASRADATGFCGRLAEYATTQAPVVVVIRADQIANLSAEPSFERLAEGGIHLVTPLTGAALRWAIEGPANTAGMRLEPGLVDLLVRDCEGEPGALPLLSHALAETWQRRDGRVLTIEGYRATGGIRGAVARSADRLYEALPEQQRPKLRSLLLRLVSPSPEGEPVRSRLPTRSLLGDAERERMLALLVRARLVTAEENSVELAHEALARAWPRLRSWLDEDAAGQRILRHLSTAADGWESLGRPATELYRGARLEAAMEWRVGAAPDLTEQEQAFLDASLAADANERARLAEQARLRTRQNRRLRRSLAAVAVLLVAALAAGALAYQQRASARRESRRSALSALTSSAAALRTNRRDLAALLAVEAYDMDPNPATGSALFGTFTAAPGLTRIVHTDVEVDTLRTDIGLIPDSDVMAAVATDGSVELFDSVSGKRSRLVGPGDDAGAVGMAVAADGQEIATVWTPPTFDESPEDRYSLLTVWDLKTRESRFAPIRVPHVASRVALDRDGSIVAASGGAEGRTTIYDARSGRHLTDIEGLARPDGADQTFSTAPVVFRDDGSLLVGSLAGPVRVLDPTDGTELGRVAAPAFTTSDQLWLTEDDTTLVSLGYSTDGPALMTFDLDAGTALQRDPTALSVSCNSWAFAERLNAVLCGTWDGRVIGSDVATGGELPRRFDSQVGPVCALATSPDGSTFVELADCLGSKATMLEWRLDGGGPVSRLVIPDAKPKVGIASLGSELVLQDWAEDESWTTTIVADPTTGEVLARYPGMYTFAPSDGSSVVPAVFRDDLTVGLFDVANGIAVGPLVHPDFDEIWGLWAAGGGHVVVKSEQNARLQGIDLDHGTLVGPRVDGSGHFEVWAAAVTDDALYTVSVDSNYTEFQLERRDLNTGEVTGQPAAGYRSVTAAGTTVVASAINGQVLPLDPVTLQPLGSAFPGINGAATDIELSGNGSTLLVRGDDESLRFYDVATRTQLGDAIDLGVSGDEAQAVMRFDGLAAVARTPQGFVVYDLDPAHWSKAACQVAGRNLTPAEWQQYIGDLAPYRRTCLDFPAG
jgi:DNA-binding SARP family transcriptional activator/WD40 repeat protein/energy-coupling factor transporter ATP-binding protein EcfA2